VSQPFSQTLDPGGTASFTATPASGFGAVIRWYHGGLSLADGATGSGSTVSGASASTLRIVNVSSHDAGNYWALVSNACGADSSVVAALNVNGETGVPGITPVTAFESAAPNPTPGRTELAFSLGRPGRARLQVFDVTGRILRRIDLGSVAAGHHRALWDGADDAGRPVRAGLVLVSLEIDGRRLASRRLAVLR
jgi:hypothetical protein